MVGDKQHNININQGILHKSTTEMKTTWFQLDKNTHNHAPATLLYFSVHHPRLDNQQPIHLHHHHHRQQQQQQQQLPKYMSIWNSKETLWT